MPPKTKAATAKSFIGQPDSVLRDEFIQEVQVNGHDSELLPFSGSLQLPTAEQVVKLFFFFKEQEGLKNSHVSQDSISERVAVHVVKYWQMAGFNTSSEFNIVKKIKKEVEKYQIINKNKSRDNPKEVEKREVYLENVQKLFDIAAPGLEEILLKDRLRSQDDQNPHYRQLGGYTRKTEDIAFLNDQRGQRKMVMGERDASFEARKDAIKNKKVVNVSEKTEESNNNEIIEVNQDEDDNEEFEYEKDDEDFKAAITRPKKKD